MTSKIPRESPYQGLVPYDERDALYFFGREKETKLIAASLFASPLTLLYGASGVGKSSVLRAGVVNFLSSRKDLIVVVFNQWQDDPLNALKIGVAEAAAKFLVGRDKKTTSRGDTKKAVDIIESFAKRKRSNNSSAKKTGGKVKSTDSASLAEYLTACAAKLKRRLMVILDQFEEYSMYHPEDDAFAIQFPEAVMQGGLSLSFLISLREDALAKLDRFEGRIPILFDNYRRVNHLDRVAATDAIVLPLDRYNQLQKRDDNPISIEPDLVEAVLDQVRTGQVIIGDAGRGLAHPGSVHPSESSRIETPYLQLVMTRLWNEEINTGSRVLRLATLHSLGGAEQIVQTHLDSVMEVFDEKDKAVAAQIFNLLVTPSGTKVAHIVGDLADYAGISSQKLTPILHRLSSGGDRILRPVPSLPGRPDEPRYEIFHDRLAPAILDWRSRYLNEQELTRNRRQEAARYHPEEVSFRRLQQRRKRVNRPQEPIWRYKNEELFPDFVIRDLTVRGKVVPVLGPDINAAARRSSRRRMHDYVNFLPAEQEVAQMLAAELNLPFKEEENDLATAASYYEMKYGRAVLYDRLREVFAKRNYETSEAHRQLARISRHTPLLIVTTNYDILTEQAFEEVGVKYDVISTNVDRGPKSSVLWFQHGAEDPVIAPSFKLDIDLDATTVIYKICGSVDRRYQGDDSYVITEEDYAELFGRILHSSALPAVFMNKIYNNHLLFIGMRVRDWKQRVLVRSLFSRGERYYKKEYLPSWSVNRDPTELEVTFWQNLDVNVYNEDINKFASQL